MKINIHNDFSRSPGPRYIDEGKNSGELFRRDVLFPAVAKALATNSLLTVELDGTSGYGTSFLEESFGGLIRENGLTLAQLNSVFRFVSDEEPDLIDEIQEDMEEAELLRKGKP